VPDYCIDEVPTTDGLLLSLVRKIPFSSARAHAGRWRCRRWCRSTGCVAQFWGWWDSAGSRARGAEAKSFGLRVVTFDPYVPQTVMDHAGVERVEFDQLCGCRLHLHSYAADAGDAHLFNAEVFRK